MAALEDAPPDDAAEQPASGLAGPGMVIAETYRITRLLGAGGMGEVYEAEHLRLGRRFAVKILRSRSDQRAISRFRRETRVVASLESDHVVDVLDCGTLRDGTPYLVMELLLGEDLRALLRKTRPLPVPRAVRIVQQAARGVTAAHRAGIVHRDLKPENLFLVRRDGDDELCKVLDFGVAKTETSELTQQGTVIGTIKYMAPEQLEDSTRVDSATDVYALGVILYECLTGEVPHEASTAQETMLKVLTEPVRPVRDRRGDVPETLSAVLARALAKKPEERFQTSAEFERMLAPFAHAHSSGPDLSQLDTADFALEPPRPRPPGDPASVTPLTGPHSPEVPSHVRARDAEPPALGRRVLALALLVALLGAALGGGAVWLLLPRESAPAPLYARDARVAPPSPAAPPEPVALPPADAVALEPLTAPDPAPSAGAAAPEKPEPAAPASATPVARPASPRPRPQPAAKPAPETPGGLPSLRLERQNPYAR